MIRSTVIYVGGFILPDGNAAAHRVIANGRLLRELGYDVIYLGSDKSIPSGTPLLSTRLDASGFEAWRTPYPGSSIEWLRYLTSISDIKKLIAYKSIDTIHSIIAYNYPAAALWKLRTLCMKSGISLIADSTEWYSADNGNLFYKILKSLDTYIRMCVIQQRTDGIICISRYLRDFYAGRGAGTLLLPPLVDLQDSKWMYDSNNGMDSIVKLVYAGSPGAPGTTAKDRLDWVLDALDVLRTRDCKFQISIIGIGKDEYLKANPLHSELVERMSDHAEFLGRIPHLQAIKRVQSSDFMIFLRDDTRITRAGFPTKLVESISCGTPVLANATSCITDYLSDGVNGFLIDVGSRDSLIVSLQSVLEINREQIDKMKRTCLESAMFDYRNYKQVFGSFMNEVVQTTMRRSNHGAK